MKITKTTSRKFEKIIGCIGSILGIISSFWYLSLLKLDFIQ